MPEPTLIVPLSPRKFIREIRKDLLSGYRFIPLLGAGLSVPSGIPTGPMLGRYLTRCVGQALGLDTQKLGRHHPWNPRRDPWPSISNKPANDAIDRTLLKVARGKDERPHIPAKLAQEAYGSLADWRMTLQFLSRVAFDPLHDVMFLGPPEGSVADSFFFHITSGKEPSLGHRMLVALMSLLRSNVILTTNFDDLIEQAFLNAGQPLRTFLVHTNGALPAASLVREERAIVKLHGGLHGLRADLSLDSPPSRSDRWRFLSYLLGNPIEEQPTEQPEASIYPDKIGIIVAGVSAADLRTQALLRLVASCFSELRVHWVCYSQADVERVREIFSTRTLGGNVRVNWVQHSDIGLLFLGLYQVCTGVIPPSGAVFPAVWTMPTPPEITPPTASPEHCVAFNRHQKDLTHQIKRYLSVKPGSKRKVIAVTSDRDIYGAQTVCANVCRHAVWPANILTSTLWLDLDDISEPAEVFLRLVMAMSKRAGTQDPMPALDLQAYPQSKAPAKHSSSKTQEEIFLQMLMAEIESVPTQLGTNWLVFLNARDGAGSNSHGCGELSPGWKDSVSVKALWNILYALTNHPGVSITFVIIRTNDDLKHYTSNQVLSQPVPEPCTAFTPARVGDAAIKWINEGNQDEIPARTQFLYALAAFRLTRYPAGIQKVMRHCLESGHCIGQDNELPVEEWLDDLTNKMVIRLKPGGFIWMNLTLRGIIRKKLDQGKHQLRPSIRLAIHGFIARWYGRLLLSSADPMAAFEAVRHALERICVYCSKSAASPDPKEDAKVLDAIRFMITHGGLVLRTAMSEIERHLTEHFTHQFLDQLQAKALVVSKHVAIRFGTAVLKPQLQSVLAALSSLREELIRSRLRVSQVEADWDGLLKFARDTSLHGTNSPAPGLELKQQIRFFEATAHLCQRRYGKARATLEELLKLARVPLPLLDYSGDWTSCPRQAAQKWAGNHSSAGHASATGVVRRMVYLQMHESQARYMATRGTSETLESRQEERKKCLKLGLW